jgi:hypothetical protein
MQRRQLHARLSAFVLTYQSHRYSNIKIFIDDAALKNARASCPFCRSRHPSKWVASHQNGSFKAMPR